MGDPWSLFCRALRSALGIFRLGQSELLHSCQVLPRVERCPDERSGRTDTFRPSLQAVYISAELSEPARQLPLSINSALPVIILCFIASNVAYYILLPWNVVSTTDSVAVVRNTIRMTNSPRPP